jgi:hypothetical protein
MGLVLIRKLIRHGKCGSINPNILKLSLTISDEGDTFIRYQIAKGISFFIKFSFILLAICIVVTGIRLYPLTTNDIVFSLVLYLITLALHYRGFLKSIKVHQHLIKSVDVDDGMISLTGYASYRREEIVYRMKLSSCKLVKGIYPIQDKLKNIYDIKDTYTLISDEHPNEYFFFISSFWEEWPEIQELILHE